MSTPASPWDRLYNDLKLQIPGVIDAVQASVTFSLFKDFCDKTNIWTEEVPILAKPNTYSYVLLVNEKGAANRLLLVYDPASAPPNKQWVQGNAQMQRPGVLTVSFPPAQDTPWMAVVAKTPSDPTNAEKYPDMHASSYWIIDKYREALTFGILARLQMMPGKPYTNAAAAKTNNQYYISERSKARTDAVKANVYGGQRWVYPQSFATISRNGAT